jgi:hypothetical protein
MSATTILLRAETLDGYRRACAENKLNAAARKGDQYAAFFVSPEQSARLRNEVFKIDLLNGADIVVVHSSADNGYPHTRPRAIVCLPDTFITSSSDEALAETLRHEAMHIHQRKFPELWKQKCIQEGWTPVPLENVPKRFRDQCRINPDTMSCPFWAWESYSVPLPMFRGETPSNLSHIRIEWLDLRTGALFHDPPPSFVAKYGSPSQPEHPYEIYAVIFASEGIRAHSSLYVKLMSSS